MTHSLHRRGSIDSLQNDYVVLITPAVNINHKESKSKLIEILDIVKEIGPVNIGSYDCGNIFRGATIEKIQNTLSETPRVRCVFDSYEKVKLLVAELKKRDYGLSVTISGLIDNIVKLSRENDIKPHSINLSIGVYGKVEALPDESVLNLVTMCGHGMVSERLVKQAVERVKKGTWDIDKAAVEIAKPCHCGIFNVERAKQILNKNLKK
ncbi:MAG: hypothetical protein VR72_02175 [Clostridiaceae bacterium BRH_c20a]|nr:MAG: hypothetical protein VR72_02175 [Clostridiaceae bacterium BRH_c20a]